MHIKLHCSSKGFVKLSNSISDNAVLTQADFLSPMPDPLQYSRMDTAANGAVSYVVTNPRLQEELKTVWNKTLNSEIASWSKYEEFSQGLFETTVGQLHDSVLASCKQDDARWPAISSDNDLISLLQMVEKICIQNVAGKKVYTPYHNLFTLDRCINWTRDNTISNDEFAAQVKVNYEAVIHQCGECAFGVNFLHSILDRNGTDMAAYDALSVGDADRVQYDSETGDLIMAMLI
jgi:hypothetical protein